MSTFYVFMKQNNEESNRYIMLLFTRYNLEVDSYSNAITNTQILRLCMISPAFLDKTIIVAEITDHCCIE